MANGVLERVSDDVELVEAHSFIRQMFIDALDESRRHVDAHRADLFRRVNVFAQIGRKAFNRRSRCSDRNIDISALIIAVDGDRGGNID
jgi:hypothetical protein